MAVFHPPKNHRILHNPGCGILYLQRGYHKLPFSAVPEDAWFRKERLADKIAIHLPWCALEPEEGRYLWEHPDWEGCFRSWINAGFKVALQIRGMDTLGTCYQEGVPQWVFDAGAAFIDEPIDAYRGTFLLNNIPEHGNAPVRYPVYWDEIYLEKTEQLVRAMGRRYNGNPNVEYVVVGHMGRWGEMHIADHGPLKPWFDAGLSLPNYIAAHKRILDVYREAFPDTPLVQDIGAPAFSETPGGRDLYGLEDAAEIFEHAVKLGIILKFDGIGKNWHGTRSRFLEDEVRDLFLHFRSRTKIAMENLILPEGLREALDCGISYWHRGGESQGLGILNVDRDLPIAEKKIYSFYRFYPEEYDALTREEEKEIWRMMARECGYRLEIETAKLEEGHLSLTIRNSGRAPFREPYSIRIATDSHSVSIPGKGPLESGEAETCTILLPPGEHPAAGIESRGHILELGNDSSRTDNLIRLRF